MDKRGITLPFRVTPGDADIATATGDALREIHVETVLSARASSDGEIGEIAWDPDRGSALDALRNAAASPAVADFAALYAERALAYALPNEVLRASDVVLDDRTIELTVKTTRLTETEQGERPISVTTQLSR